MGNRYEEPIGGLILTAIADLDWNGNLHLDVWGKKPDNPRPIRPEVNPDKRAKNGGLLRLISPGSYLAFINRARKHFLHKPA